MCRKKLEFRLISRSDVDHLERTPHNPPRYSDTFSPEDFSAEWRTTRAELKQCLEAFGQEWEADTDAGDFMLSESRGDSRWIYITFVSTRLWCPKFTQAVADSLARLPQDYRVGCLTDLNDQEAKEQPLVYLVISATTVLGHVYKSPHEVLGKFGFPV